MADDYEQRRSRAQRALREHRGEKSFVFDRELANCLGEFDRDSWERAISSFGGDVPSAARACGLDGVPRGAKALWGQTPEEALAIYRRWQKKRGAR